MSEEVDKILANAKKVKAELEKVQDYKDEALEAAKLLDSLVGLDADESDIRAKDYLTGDPVSDASWMRTVNMHEACSSEFDFVTVVQVLFDAAGKVGGILAVFLV